MPQGEGFHAARGGAPGVGAGRGTETGGTSELVPVEGRAPGLGTELGQVGGGAWSLEEELEQAEGGASGLETEGDGAQALGAGLQSVSGVATVQERGSSSIEGGAPGQGAELRPLKGGVKEQSEGVGPGNGPGRPRGGGLRGGRAWGRSRPRTPPGEVVWVERARRPPDTGPVWVPRRPPRAQSWGGAPGGGTGPAWGVPPEDRGSPEPPSGDVWVPRGRPPAAASEVWVCWAGGNWVWREWDRSVEATAGQPDKRHEAELGPDSIVHLPECPGHCCGGRGQTEAADRGQEAGRPLSHQVAQGGRPAHALHAWHQQAVTMYCELPKGKLEDGTEFDSSLPQNQPFVFSLGTGQVIKGWDQGLLGMCEGEKRKLVIPSELGYGERGAPPKIPGGATLVFEVELLKIERRSEL